MADLTCHPGAHVGLDGCVRCGREAFAEWLSFVGERRICDGSGMREHDVACPGCAACCTSATPCPAFALPDVPWIPESERAKPCALCGEPQATHRPMPELTPRG